MADNLKNNLRMKRTAELVNAGMPVSRAMREAGYTEGSAKALTVTKSKDWATILERELGDNMLAKEHKKLLKANRLDHMVFPTGPKTEQERQDLIDADINKAQADGSNYIPKEYMTDDDIKEMLEGVGCTLRRIAHGEQSRHAYFWAPDNRAKKDALEMAYKLKNRFAPDKVFVPIAPNPETENLVLGVLDLFVKRAQADQDGGRVINITPEPEPDGDQ